MGGRDHVRRPPHSSTNQFTSSALLPPPHNPWPNLGTSPPPQLCAPVAAADHKGLDAAVAAGLGLGHGDVGEEQLELRVEQRDVLAWARVLGAGRQAGRCERGQQCTLAAPPVLIQMQCSC